MLTQSDRERSHLDRLAQINRVQVVVGRADRARVDHEGTLVERARLLCEEIDAHRATERGLAAFARLLRLAEEEHHSPAGRQVIAFLGAVWSGEPLRIASLRAAAPSVGDDMLAVLDAFRHARLNLAEEVEGGAARVARVVRINAVR
jgi:hypothetical protein